MTLMNQHAVRPGARGLYDPLNEHDACGVGFLVTIDGTRTHAIMERSVEVLKNLLHRGAMGGDQQTSDGAGVLFQVPDAFLRRECARLRFVLPPEGQYGVGMVFLPRREESEQRCRRLIEETVRGEGLRFLGWRDVPTDPAVLGDQARRTRPAIAQCFVAWPEATGRGAGAGALERKLYVIRKQIEATARHAFAAEETMYVSSFSCRTITYKGMLFGEQVSTFYPDLTAPELTSAIVVVHQRYSTNTFPSWELAQPFRYLAHNGEINTLRGNRSQMTSRENSLASERFGSDMKKLLPVLEEDGSDSANLDNALELLVNGGRSIQHAVAMLIPEAWGVKYPIGPDLRGFVEYHAGIMEPWDGPAMVSFSDGTRVGAVLDRNGLRPARYTITGDGFMVMASEAGVLSFAGEDIAEKGILRPGEMILVDVELKRVLKDKEIKGRLARQQPYRRWVAENRINVHGFFDAVAPLEPDEDQLFFRQKLFGYTREDLKILLDPMASRGHEPTGSMGADTPLAVFSEKPQLLFSYFKQLFAQVTNPPIDPIREELVMSLMTFMGNPANILTEVPQNARLVKLRHPILTNEDLERIKHLNVREFRAREIPIAYPARGSAEDLEEALDQLRSRAAAAVNAGENLLILTDRDLPDHLAPMPSLLAVSAVNQHLIREGLRTMSSLILQTGEPREVMHMALLLGYGATAINPYLAFETVAHMARRGELSGGVTVAKALEHYIKAIQNGLLKIMSKMGISTLRSYRSAQVFEAVGLADDLVDVYFTGTSSRIGGIGLREIVAEANARFEAAHRPVIGSRKVLPAGGRYRLRRDGERHLWTHDSISTLQQATRRNDAVLYRRFAAQINEQAERLSTLRGMFRFTKQDPIPLEEVEPASEIMKRFVTGAMSFGSISREAHETLAIAMNRIGGMSNSGEGGEDPARYAPLRNGDSRSSAVKQVASGRFGVTAEYCVNARELQIKIAQGAKPGEGGQLPGHKVNAEIARVRHATPGVSLISPPPHHDIYSIEDIKQLIYDLKNVNPDARVSVKLVSEVGVGTVAAGVAKAHADMVLISGYDGGTGASPLSSIQHTGVPWELGLAETQQTLVLNGLRSRIRVQTDGQVRTGRDVAVAALLGAEEFGFATAPLVVSGCVMMRQCHQNTCPVGVATQDPELRKRFSGKPEYLVNYFTFVAEELREIMAALGVRTVDDMVGRADFLAMNEAIDFYKARGLDFSRVLYFVPPTPAAPIRCTETQNHELDQALDNEIIPRVERSLETKEPVAIELPIRNVHRTVGTQLSSRIARRYGHAGLPEDTITCTFTGSAGQSFGAFCARGLTFILEGEANDYLGKALAGGKIIVKPFRGARFDPAQNIVAGNVILYGATGGEVYLHGLVGERFAIRNSGACAVVEGVGDHGCEYMTGGRVVVLGRTGVNFAAGMSGGIAYVFDEDGTFDGRCNLDMVDLELATDPKDQAELRAMIERHHRYTGSRRAKDILDNWEDRLPYFVKVFPMEYRRVLGQMSREDEATEREEVIHG